MKIRVSKIFNAIGVISPVVFMLASMLGGIYTAFVIMTSISIIIIFCNSDYLKTQFHLLGLGMFFAFAVIIGALYLLIIYQNPADDLFSFLDAEYISIFFKFIFGPATLCLSAIVSWEDKKNRQRVMKILMALNIVMIFCMLQAGLTTGYILGNLHSNQMGAFSAFSFAVAVIILKFDHDLAFLGWSLVSIAIISLLFSLSRGALLACMLACLLYLFVFLFKKRRVFIRLALIFFLYLCVWIPLNFQFLLQHDAINSSALLVENITNKRVLDNGRFKFWIMSINNFTASPVFGNGIYAKRSWTRELENGEEIKLSPHNYYIAVLEEGGLLGMALIVILIYAVYCLITKHNTRVSSLSIPLLLGVLIHQLMEVSLTTGSLMVGGLFWYLFGLIVRLSFILNYEFRLTLSTYRKISILRQVD